jgi:hypothetical protein
MSPDDQVISCRVVQGVQHVSEILVQQRFRLSWPKH